MGEMAKHPWLTQRNGVFYVRAPVPQDIAKVVGKHEVTYSLKTKDRREALRKLPAEVAAISSRFEAARKANSGCQTDTAPQQPVSAIDPLSAAQIQRWCDNQFQRVVDEDFEKRCGVLKNVNADPEGFHDDLYIEHPTSEWYHTFYEELSVDDRVLCCLDHAHKQRLKAVRHAMALGDCGDFEKIADEIIQSDGKSVSSTDRRRLIRRLMETEIAAYDAIIRQDSSRCDEIAARYAKEAGTPPSSTTPLKDSGPILGSLVERFLKEGERSGLVKKTTLSDKTDLREFVEIVGDKPIRNYTAEDGTRYKDALLSVPSQRKVAPFTGLNIAQAAAEADKRDPGRREILRLHVDTINDKLMVVRKFFRWADAHLKNVSNPVDGLRIKPTRHKGRRSKTRYPFTTQELQQLFLGKVYSDPLPRRSANFWVPLIGLFSGMRLGEIIQLRVSDVKTVDGITFFNVTTAMDENDGEGNKSTKNENSIREVPVHRGLLDIGFGEFLKFRRDTASTRLFPEYSKSPTDDSWSKTFSAWFTRYRRGVGVNRIVDGKNRVDFHSFRHVFEDAVRDLPEVKKEWRDALQGHGEGGSSEGYGLGVRLQRLNEVMQKVRFEGLDLSHLHRPPA